MNGKMFYLMKLSNIYCNIDCEVLMDGHGVFRTWMLEHTQLVVYIIL